MKTDKIYDIVIVGAGASGLFLMANLHHLGFNGEAIILEKNATPGKKILASGGGRCNITNRNITYKNYLGDEKFIKEALKEAKFGDVLEFFKELKFKEQKNTQFFCQSGARSVLNVLLKEANANIIYNCEVESAYKNGEIFEILCKNELKFHAKNLIIASGGISYKSLGVSDVALKIASNFGLAYTPFSPALVGFTVQRSEFWFKNLSGVCFGAEILVGERKITGDVLFTHKGISGPAVLNASLFWQKGVININFAPNFDLKRLNSGKKQLSSVLELPRRFTLEFLHAKGLKDRAYSEYNADDKAKISEIFSYYFAPAGTFGFERAEVAKGGVSTAQIGQNFEAKGVKGLYFIGECLDVTGMLGGYNLHFAFASAKRTARAIIKENNAKRI